MPEIKETTRARKDRKNLIQSLKTCWFSKSVNEQCTILVVFSVQKKKPHQLWSCVVHIPSISLISSYLVNVFLCARLYVRSLSNVKAYIHCRVCVRVRMRVYDEPDLIIPQGNIACLVSPSLVQNMLSINWAHTNAWSDINSMTDTRVKRCSNPLSSAAAQLSYWVPQVEEPNSEEHTWSAECISFQESLIPVTHTCVVVKWLWRGWISLVLLSACHASDSALCFCCRINHVYLFQPQISRVYSCHTVVMFVLSWGFCLVISCFILKSRLTFLSFQITFPSSCATCVRDLITNHFHLGLVTLCV